MLGVVQCPFCLRGTVSLSLHPMGGVNYFLECRRRSCYVNIQRVKTESYQVCSSKCFTLYNC